MTSKINANWKFLQMAWLETLNSQNNSVLRHKRLFLFHWFFCLHSVVSQIFYRTHNSPCIVLACGDGTKARRSKHRPKSIYQSWKPTRIHGDRFYPGIIYNNITTDERSDEHAKFHAIPRLIRVLDRRTDRWTNGPTGRYLSDVRFVYGWFWCVSRWGNVVCLTLRICKQKWSVDYSLYYWQCYEPDLLI